VVCITPISPHTFTLRPVVVPANKTISLQLASTKTNMHIKQANIIADGNYAGTINYDEKFDINIYDKEVKIIVPEDSNYFDVLRNKLL
jgi:NAD+ kinase